MYEDKKRADYAKSEHTCQFKECLMKQQTGKAAKSDASQRTFQMKVDQMGEKAVQRQNIVQLASDVIQAYKCQNCKQEINKQGRGHLTWCKAQKVQPTSTNHDRDWGKDDDDRHEHGLKNQHTNANQQNFYRNTKHHAGKNGSK